MGNDGDGLSPRERAEQDKDPISRAENLIAAARELQESSSKGMGDAFMQVMGPPPSVAFRSFLNETVFGLVSRGVAPKKAIAQAVEMFDAIDAAVKKRFPEKKSEAPKK